MLAVVLRRAEPLPAGRDGLRQERLLHRRLPALIFRTFSASISRRRPRTRAEPVWPLCTRRACLARNGSCMLSFIESPAYRSGGLASSSADCLPWAGSAVPGCSRPAVCGRPRFLSPDAGSAATVTHPMKRPSSWWRCSTSAGFYSLASSRFLLFCSCQARWFGRAPDVDRCAWAALRAAGSAAGRIAPCRLYHLAARPAPHPG